MSYCINDLVYWYRTLSFRILFFIKCAKFTLEFSFIVTILQKSYCIKKMN